MVKLEKSIIKLFTYLTMMAIYSVILCSCAGNQFAQKHSHNSTKEDMKYKNVFIKQVAIIGNISKEVPAHYIAEMPLYCAAELMKSDLFDKVLFDTDIKSDKSTLIVQTEIIRSQIVSDRGAAILVGGLAGGVLLPGTSSMNVKVKLVDADTDVVRAEKIFEEGSFTANVIRAGVKDYTLHELLCQQIADYVIKVANKSYGH
ncbi:MAG: hypothetical protein PHN75_11810 [Syntrophales bacterium]|nr:hypothetical protein [Syntrophales bacterium]